MPLMLLPVLTRYLSPVEYGQVAMFQTLIAGLAAFTGLSVHAAANRKYFDDGLSRYELKCFIGTCIQVLLLSTTVVSIIILILIKEISLWIDLEKTFIILAIVTSASGFVINILLGQWQARKQAAKYGLMQISQNVINMILSILLVVYMLQGSSGRIYSQVLVSIGFMFLAFYILNRSDLLKLNQWNYAYFKEAIYFGLPLIPHIAGSFLIYSIDRFVINSKLGLAQAGIYMLAVQLSSALGMAFDAINNAYVPWLFEKLKLKNDSQNKKLVIYTYIYFSIVLFVVLIIAIIGPNFILLVAGEKYSQAGEIIGWLALGQAFSAMYFMVMNYIMYSKKTGYLSLATIASGIINVFLIFILIDIFGVKGAAIAFCLSMIIRFLLTWWGAQKSHPMPWFNFK